MGSFFGLGDIFKSILTAPGTNARNNQQQGQQQVGQYANDAAKVAGPNWIDALKYGQQYNPQIQAGINSAFNSSSGAGLRESAIRGGNYAREQAMSKQVPLMFASNPDLANAYRAQQINTANQQSNHAIQQSTDPTVQAHALMAALGLQQNYQNMAFQPYQQAAGISYGQPQVQVGPGILDYLGGAAGSLFGGKSVGLAGGSQNSVGNVANSAVQGIGGGAGGVSSPYNWMFDYFGM